MNKNPGGNTGVFSLTALEFLRMIATKRIDLLWRATIRGNMKRRNLLIMVMAVLLPGCSKRVVYDTPSQKPERQFAATPRIVSAELASKLANGGFSIQLANDMTVIARKFEPRLHGLFTSAPPNSSTQAQYAFTLIGKSDGTMVIADASIVVINGLGVEHAVPNAPNVIVEEMHAFLNSVKV